MVGNCTAEADDQSVISRLEMTWAGLLVELWRDIVKEALSLI